ncbi:MAG: hypothetical protein M3O15_10095, partial [Acidobacteriota bacterium]|nr:hypothetical protein [Acidobacteriota bacterium]
MTGSAVSPPLPASRPLTLAGLLRTQAALRPDQVAFVFLADGEVEAGRLTYSELDRQARAIGGALAAT